jgi:hypothetical protein
MTFSGSMGNGMDWQYLLYIAVLSSGYVGFTSFFIALRQVIGANADKVATWSMRYLITVALCTTTTALLPPLLSMMIPPATAIRIAGGAACVLMTRLDIIFVYRLPLVYKEPLGSWFWFLFAIALGADVGFGACAAGVLPGKELATFCSAETVELAVMFCYFSNALMQLLPFDWELEPQRGRRSSRS